MVREYRAITARRVKKNISWESNDPFDQRTSDVFRSEELARCFARK
jgi:hypothetical protein